MTIEEQIQYTNNLLNILPDGVIIVDPDGKVLQINQQAQKELHTTQFNCLNHNRQIQDLFKLIYNNEDILSPLIKSIRKGKSNGKLPDGTLIRENVDHTLFPVSGQFSTLQENGKLSSILFFFRNITDDLTQKYILNTALKRTKIYPWYYDISRHEFTLDPRYFQYMELPARDNCTLTMEEYINMIHPDDRKGLFDAFSVQLSGNETYEKPVPFRLHRNNGTWEWFEGQSTYITTSSGQPYRLVGICMSIQEYKDIEKTLIDARIKAEESDRLKMAFLANMSHEIRTPLNAIVGFSDVLSISYEELDQAERDDFVRLISTNSDHLVRLIDDILDLSKIESNTMEFSFSECSIKALLADIEKEQTIKISPDIEIKALLPDKDIIIQTDPKRLKQVICNLINNARKFTEEGFIHFGVRQTEKNTVMLFVEDSGKGIPEKHLQEIFERFYKVDSFKQGTGLGLSICRTILERLKGTISVTSQVGKGSCFTVTLPA